MLKVIEDIDVYLVIWAEKLEKLLSAIDDLDDVTNVYTNAE